MVALTAMLLAAQSVAWKDCNEVALWAACLAAYLVVALGHKRAFSLADSMDYEWGEYLTAAKMEEKWACLEAVQKEYGKVGEMVDELVYL